MAQISLVSVWVCLVAELTVASFSSILYQSDANGSLIVLQAIGTLQQSGVFENDNELLRRISYVETRDGKLSNASNGGGIWAVRESKFLQTKHLESSIQLPDKLQQIQHIFGINWISVQWRDLNMPLYSIIAARLVLYLAPQKIPPISDLKAQAKFWLQYYNTDGDEDEFIGVAYALQGGNLDNSANEFFLGFTRNIQGLTSVTLQLFVTTPELNPVRFTVNATGFSYSGIATRNLSTSVTLPNTLQIRSVSERDKGIYVKAEENRKIAVYGLNHYSLGSDAFLALPCNHLPIDEYEYNVVAYPIATRFDGRHQIALLIVACNDRTVVNTGSSAFVALNRFQTYLIRSLNDLTGRRLTSNKPIALFSNHECAEVPSGIYSCDPLTEQIPPTLTWGKVFMAASLLERRSGEILRIVAAQTPTNVTINCTNFTQPVTYFTISLTAAVNWQQVTITPNSFCSIVSTASILVTQFALGGTKDGITGDPFMMLIPPVEQFYTNNFVFYSPSMFSLNCITVYVGSQYFQPDRIFVDEINPNSSLWSQIRGCSTKDNVCGYSMRMNLISGGDHQVYHLDQDARLSVSVYGFMSDNSYGYPGGMKLTPLQLPIVSFLSATYSYNEEIGGVVITITRSGNTETPAVVLVASSSVQIITCDGYLPASPVLEFQPGETKKQITVTLSNITRSGLYLSAGKGVYLTPFPRTEIIVDGLSGYQNYGMTACVCHGLELNCSCHCSPTIPSDSNEDIDSSSSFCIWCITTAAVLSATVVGVIMLVVLVVSVCMIKKKKQSADKRDIVEMQMCEAYNTIKHSSQGYETGMGDDPVYDEVGTFYDTCTNIYDTCN